MVVMLECGVTTLIVQVRALVINLNEEYCWIRMTTYTTSPENCFDTQFVSTFSIILEVKTEMLLWPKICCFGHKNATVS